MKNILIFVFSILLMFFGCNINESKEINIYSQRHYEVDRKQYENFEKETGIKVRLIESTGISLIERLKREGENSKADIIFEIDEGKRYFLNKSHLLAIIIIKY